MKNTKCTLITVALTVLMLVTSTMESYAQHFPNRNNAPAYSSSPHSPHNQNRPDSDRRGNNPPPPPPQPAVQPPAPPVPPLPPPPPPIRQYFSYTGAGMNLGNIQFDGINLTAGGGVMSQDSSIEIEHMGHSEAMAAAASICPNRAIQAVSDYYRIRVENNDGYFGLPVKYAIKVNAPVYANNQSFYMLVKLDSIYYLIPATVSTPFGMVIGEIDSCAAYEDICLVVDTDMSLPHVCTFYNSSSFDSNNVPVNPHYASLSEDDGFGLSTVISSTDGANFGCSNLIMTAIQPNGSSNVDIYKYQGTNTIFVQSLPFSVFKSYSFCKFALDNFYNSPNPNCRSYAMWFSFANTNLEEIPEALILRSTYTDVRGVNYSTTDQLIYVSMAENNYDSPFSGGNGSKNAPYVITNQSQLDQVRDYKRRYFILGSDIDLYDYNNGNGWLALGSDDEPFNGVLDGNGHTIYNVNVNENEDYQGLFGCIKNGSVRNLRVNIGSNGISGNNYCGGLTGYAANARFQQIYVTGCISGQNNIGGLAGYTCNNTVFRQSMSDVTINTEAEEATAGGLIGYSDATTITDCHTAVNITATGHKSSVGGIVAQAENTKLQNCYSTGSVVADMKGYAGGIVGYLHNSEVKGSIAINTPVKGSDCGRIAGKAVGSSFTRCFGWSDMRDLINRTVSDRGFGGNDATQSGRNGESIEKKSFWSSSTRNKFWTVNKKVGFNLDSWIFNKGYNLPQLRNMPSIADPSL